jgi:hypothetical protein
MENTTHTATGDEIAKRIGFTPKMSSLDNWPSTGETHILDEELKEMGTFLIKKYRTDLIGTNIGYVFKEKASRSGDNVNYGDSKSQPPLQKVLSGLDACIIIGWDEWNALDLDNRLRVMFHEIEKLTHDEKSGKLKVQAPTVQTFPSVIQIFGPSTQAEIAYISAYDRFSKDSGGGGILK